MSSRTSEVAELKRLKADAQGWVSVTLKEYREFYEPLRRRDWTAEDKKRVRAFADGGGAYALRRFCAGHRAAAAQLEAELGEGVGAEPEPLSREELEASMRSLISNCVRADWTADMFAEFEAYLDSDAPVEALKAGGATTSAATSPSHPIEKTEDTFAESYRGASPAFQAVVKKHLRDAASRLTEKGRKLKVAPVEKEVAPEEKADVPPTGGRTWWGAEYAKPKPPTQAAAGETDVAGMLAALRGLGP